MLRALAQRTRQRSLILATNPWARVKLTAPLLHPYWRMQFHSFGARSICSRPYWLQGANRIAVGDDVTLLGVWLAVVGPVRWGTDPEPALRIGDGVAVLPYGRIVVAESVVIEDYASIAAGCLIVDNEHTKAGSWESFGEGPLDTAPTRIGRGAMLGEHVTVLKGSNIGRSCLIGTNSVVGGDIPDYSVAVGAPARVVGRTREP